MKHKNCTSYLAEDRNRELLRAYNRIVRGGGYARFGDIYEQLESVPSSRFWVTGQRAYEYIIKRKAGVYNKEQFAERKAMYAEIEKRVNEYIDENGVPLKEACHHVVLQPAPCFYLSRHSIKQIILRVIKSR